MGAWCGHVCAGTLGKVEKAWLWPWGRWEGIIGINKAPDPLILSAPVADLRRIEQFYITVTRQDDDWQRFQVVNAEDNQDWLCSKCCAPQNVQWAKQTLQCAMCNTKRAMSYVEHKMGKEQCAPCNRKKKHLSNAPHLLWWPRVMTVIVNGSKHEKNQNEKRCKTGQNSSWMWRCVLRHLTECQVLFLSETSKIFQESQVRHSKEKSQPLKRKIRGRPKEKSDLAKKKPQKLFGVKANVVFFLDWPCLREFSPPKLFRKFFLLTKNGFWQTGPNSILWKSVRSTLIFWPLKNLYWRAQGNQLWTVSHELCYISSEKATYIVFIFSHFHRCVVCPQHVKPMQWRWNVSMWNCGWCLVAFKMQTGLGRQDWDGSLATQTGGRHCCSSWTDQSQMFIVDKLDQSR